MVLWCENSSCSNIDIGGGSNGIDLDIDVDLDFGSVSGQDSV